MARETRAAIGGGPGTSHGDGCARGEALRERMRHAVRPVRVSLAALGGALGLVLAVSLFEAASPALPPPARVGLCVAAWATVALLLAWFFLPAFHVVPGRLVTRARAADGRAAVALTFDDGPHPETTPGLLAALAAANVRATFFLVGENVRRWPELARAIAAAGHVVGNHTQRHRLLTFRTHGQVEDEIAECQAAIAEHLGVRPTLFRAPHGFKPVGLAAALRPHGLRAVAWQGSVRDTDAPGADVIAERALRLAGPGRVLLLHDNPTTRGQTAEAIARIAAGCRARGLDLIALE